MIVETSLVGPFLVRFPAVAGDRNQHGVGKLFVGAYMLRYPLPLALEHGASKGWAGVFGFFGREGLPGGGLARYNHLRSGQTPLLMPSQRRRIALKGARDGRVHD